MDLHFMKKKVQEHRTKKIKSNRKRQKKKEEKNSVVRRRKNSNVTLDRYRGYFCLSEKIPFLLSLFS